MKRIFLVLLSLFITSQIYAINYNDTYLDSVVTTKGELSESVWLDVAAASSATLTKVRTDGGIVITTATLVSGGTTYVRGAGIAGKNNQFTDVVFPRDIQVDIEFMNGEATTTCNGSMVIAGYNGKGEETTETLSISTNPAYSQNAWNSISTFTFSGFTVSGASGGGDALGPISTCTIHIGVGNKLGIYGDIRKKEDVSFINCNGVNITTSAWVTGCINPTYDTFVSSRLVVPDASKDYIIRYKKNARHQ